MEVGPRVVSSFCRHHEGFHQSSWEEFTQGDQCDHRACADKPPQHKKGNSHVEDLSFQHKHDWKEPTQSDIS